VSVGPGFGGGFGFLSDVFAFSVAFGLASRFAIALVLQVFERHIWAAPLPPNYRIP
jgi:hypothetical protein